MMGFSVELLLLLTGTARAYKCPHNRRSFLAIAAVLLSVRRVLKRVFLIVFCCISNAVAKVQKIHSSRKR
jgi:hypothetical protein